MRTNLLFLLKGKGLFEVQRKTRARMWGVWALPSVPGPPVLLAVRWSPSLQPTGRMETLRLRVGTGAHRAASQDPAP